MREATVYIVTEEVEFLDSEINVYMSMYFCILE
jgi:hypothetical protein